MAGGGNISDVDRTWWREAVVYQLYPRSFNDSDGDGVGDLPGAREKVPHLDDLGVDVVWLNPVYDSPQVDAGYDVRDYYAVDDDYGTMADLEGLLADLHDRDMRMIMDLVVNHTSDEHEWFRRSRRGDPAFADYYHGVALDPVVVVGVRGVARPGAPEPLVLVGGVVHHQVHYEADVAGV